MMDALTLSKLIWQEADQKGIALTHTKLQKLLYIVYGGYYCRYKKTMFNETPIYFPKGPVFGSIIDEYQSIDFSKTQPKEIELDKNDMTDIKNVIDGVFDVFGTYDVKTLTDWTHREDSAWAKVNKTSYEKWGTRLKLADIKKEFSGLVETWYISSIPHLKAQIIEGMNTPLSECIPASEITW